MQSAIRKWVEDNWNEGVLKRVNNETFVIRFTHERRRACTTFKRTSVRSEVNFWLCSWSIKEDNSNKHLQI
jgi:hypothetical protein